jgi:hypothetical protein
MQCFLTEEDNKKPDCGSSDVNSGLVFRPLNGEEFVGCFGGDFSVGHLDGASEDGVRPGGDISSSRKYEFVGSYANALKALTVGHDEVGVGDGGSVNEDRVGADLVLLVPRFHDGAGRPINNDDAPFFDLDYASEYF